MEYFAGLRSVHTDDSITVTAANATLSGKWMCNQFCITVPIRKIKGDTCQCYGDGDGVVLCEQPFTCTVAPVEFLQCNRMSRTTWSWLLKADVLMLSSCACSIFILYVIATIFRPLEDILPPIRAICPSVNSLLAIL